MCNNSRVLNVSNGHTMKHKQALKGIGNAALAWVEIGVSVRALTIAEAVEVRHAQPKALEPLPFAELPGIIYRPAESNQASYRQEIMLMREANRFAATLLGA